MKIRIQLATAAILGSASALFGLAAHAAGPDTWQACQKEIARYCPEAKGDDPIFQCIEKREALGARSGLSKECNEAHERYEKQSGKETEEHEHHEHHQD